MIIRPYDRDLDGKAVRLLGERSSFPMPNLDLPYYIVKEVAVEQNKIVALGTIRLTSEVMTIMDLEASPRVRSVAVAELLQTGIMKSQNFGVDETHAFLTGEYSQTFAKVLKRKFGFVDCQGLPLVLHY